KQQIKCKAFSPVLNSMSRFVETVYTYLYSENNLNNYAVFLNALIGTSILLAASYSSLVQTGFCSLNLVFRSCRQTDGRLFRNYIHARHSANNIFVAIVINEHKTAISLLASKPTKDTLLCLLQFVYWDTNPNGQGWYTKIGSWVLG
ncbi:hypothetical protein, partial, partial [Parasitella parasitica]